MNISNQSSRPPKNLSPETVVLYFICTYLGRLRKCLVNKGNSAHALRAKAQNPEIARNRMYKPFPNGWFIFVSTSPIILHPSMQAILNPRHFRSSAMKCFILADIDQGEQCGNNGSRTTAHMCRISITARCQPCI